MKQAAARAVLIEAGSLRLGGLAFAGVGVAAGLADPRLSATGAPGISACFAGGGRR